MAERVKSLSTSRVDMLYPSNEKPTFESQVVGAVSYGETLIELSIRGGAPTDSEIVSGLADIADYPSRFTDFTGKITVLPIDVRNNPWANGTNARILFAKR